MGSLEDSHARHVSVAAPLFEVDEEDVISTPWVRSGERRGFAFSDLKVYVKSVKNKLNVGPTSDGHVLTSFD
jgi:hypothetical protein